jgi:hypothetical protein
MCAYLQSFTLRRGTIYRRTNHERIKSYSIGLGQFGAFYFVKQLVHTASAKV